MHHFLYKIAIGLCFILPSALFASQQASQHSTPHKDFDYKHQDEWEFHSGDHQSPIDIDTHKLTIMKDSGKIVLSYSDNAKFESNNGHSIQVDDSGSSILNGRNFELEQFHFHSPSEHTIDGKNYPLEVHFVNKSQSGRIAVVGVFFNEGKFNQGFQDVLDNIDNKLDTKPIHIDVNNMVPDNKSYYHYLGSLTTPPLLENVEWYVLATPVEISKPQIEQFNKYYRGNNRNTKPIGDRTILLYKE